nr:hypothetical protein CFP56_69288 [Quercus suber]
MVVEVHSQSKSQSKQRELWSKRHDVYELNSMKVATMVEDNATSARVVAAKISTHDDFEVVIQGLDEAIHGDKVAHGVDSEGIMERQQYHAQVGPVDVVFNPGWAAKTGGKKSNKGDVKGGESGAQCAKPKTATTSDIDGS